MIIGSHVSFSKDEGLLGSLKEALSYNAKTFMFYTGAPTSTIRSEINIKKTMEAYELMKQNNVSLNDIICHAPYIVNLANKSDLSKWNFSIDFIKKELDRCSELGIKYLVLHPGSAVGISSNEGINNIVEGLNKIITNETYPMILLETMAGKGTEVGVNPDQIEQIINSIKIKNKIGICLDTCHIFDSGYQISDYINIIQEKGLIDKIKCVHINDSKNIFGSHKDRHENIGFGNIGFSNLLNVIYDERLKNVPKILETPYIDKQYPPYKFEIDMIKNKNFDIDLLNKIKNYYK